MELTVFKNLYMESLSTSDKCLYFFQRELYGPTRATLQEGGSMLPLQQTLSSEEIVHELLSLSRSVGQLSRAQQHVA